MVYMPVASHSKHTEENMKYLTTLLFCFVRDTSSNVNILSGGTET